MIEFPDFVFVQNATCRANQIINNRVDRRFIGPLRQSARQLGNFLLSHSGGAKLQTTLLRLRSCCIKGLRGASNRMRNAVNQHDRYAVEAWEETEAELTRRYADWLPTGGLASRHYTPPEQKCQEMDLADLVLVPGTFVEKTIRAFHPNKRLARAPYGVDLDFWSPGPRGSRNGSLRFLYAGQLSIRKGVPVQEPRSLA
jgi:glycosyltransferase involved in cell wall biosynthesis